MKDCGRLLGRHDGREWARIPWDGDRVHRIIDIGPPGVATSAWIPRSPRRFALLRPRMTKALGLAASDVGNWRQALHCSKFTAFLPIAALGD